MADLWRYYHLDLEDMYRGRVRPGVVAALVEHLPAGSAIGRELGGANAVSAEFQAIGQLDHTVRMAVWVFGGKSGPKPEPWKLPEAKRDREARAEREAEAKRRWQERTREMEARRAAGERLTLRDL